MAKRNVSVERTETRNDERPSRRPRGPVQKAVYLIRGDQVVRRFEYSETGEEGKMPKKQADAFLQLVLADPDHELHDALKRGELETIEGKSEVRQPRQKCAI